MFLGYFTERPYQDRSADWYQSALPILDLSLSNGVIDPKLQADLYHRFLDEKLYVEEMGFDGVMLNSHHSTPFCMGGGPMNSRPPFWRGSLRRLKIVLLGNVLPIWDDPLWLVEELGMIDVLSRGRLVSGWVRGTGRESFSHNAQPPYNWERFQEAHDFIIKAWTTPGPFRWEGDHYQYRYVNPWVRPLPAAASADLGAGFDQPSDGRVGRPPPLRLCDARQPAASHRRRCSTSTGSMATEYGYRSRAAAPRLHVQGPRRRHRREGLRDRAQADRGRRQPVPRRQQRPGQPWAQNLAGSEPPQEVELPADRPVRPSEITRVDAGKTASSHRRGRLEARGRLPRGTPRRRYKSGTACSSATPRSSALQTPSSPRSATSWRHSVPATSSSGTATAT